MAEPTEVAIEYALLERLLAITLASPDDVTFALPNKLFTAPNPVLSSSRYVKADILWAPTSAISIAYDAPNQHLGIFQASVFHGQGGGEGPPARLAAQIIAWFARGTSMVKDGVRVTVHLPPYRGNLLRDDPWVMIPITIPFRAFV